MEQIKKVVEQMINITEDELKDFLSQSYTKTYDGFHLYSQSKKRNPFLLWFSLSFIGHFILGINKGHKHASLQYKCMV